MDLDQLHTFLEIVRLKSFSKAAQSCFRTQPAVSAQVRQLEQEMNAPLFERLGTKVALTPAGQIFADYAEQILELKRRAQDAIHELERVPRGELVIAANEATCIYVLPRVFSEIKAIMPPKHPLAGKSMILPADLADVQLLMPKAGVTRSRLNAWLEPVDENLSISMELDATEMIKRFVMAEL